MIRRLFGVLLVLTLIVAGFFYNQRLSHKPALESASAAGQQASVPDHSAPAAVAGADGQTAPVSPVATAGQAPQSPQGVAVSPAASALPAAAAAPSGQSVAAAPAVTPSPADPAAPAAEEPPQVKNGRLLVTLPNGLTVLIQEDSRFPLVSERLYVRAGSSYEKPAEAGISHLLEHMVFNKTKTRPKGGVATDIESVGGEVNASTSFDNTTYLADLPAASWRLGLEVFQDMTFGAAFDPEELTQEKKVVIAELKKGQDEPGRVLFQKSQQQVWSGKPYEFPVIGFEDTVNAVTSEDLHAYVRRFYQPQSMVLVVVGDVKAAEVLSAVKQLYGGLQNDRSIPLPEDLGLAPGIGGPKITVEAGKWGKCHVQLAFSVPGLHAAQDVPLDVLADLLGGGKTSRLYRKFFYQQHLVDTLDAGSITLERGGMLVVDATLSPDKLEAFWSGLTAELAGLKAESFTDEELDRAKLNIENSLFLAKETLKGLATKLGYYQFYGYGFEGEANTLFAVRTVDRAQLQGLLGRYIQPANASLAVLLPSKDQAEADAAGQQMLATLKEQWPGSAVASVETQQEGKAGAPEVVDLGQGRTVVLLPDPTLPYASVTLSYRGGDSLLAPNEQGLSELMSKSLTRSTQTRTAPQIEDFLANRASSITAGSGRDSFILSARYPARFAGDILELFTETVRAPAFAPEEFERARQMQIASIAQAQDKPTSLAFRHLFPFLLPGSYYGYFRSGQPAEVEAYTPQQAKALWEKQRAMPWVLSVCGVYDRAAVLALANALTHGPAGNALAFTAPAWGQEREMALTLKDRNQTHLFWVFPVSGQEGPDTPALELLKAALAGQSGVLFHDLRDEQGLGYSVTAFLWQAPETGFMALYIGTYPDKAGQSMAAFQKVVAQLAGEGLDQEDVNRAKQVLEGEYYIDHQSLSSRSQTASQNLILGYPLDRDREIIAKAQKVTKDDLIAVAKKYLDPSKAYLLKIVP